MKNKYLILCFLGLFCHLAGEAREPFSRGFEGRNKIFIPAGSFGGGISASYRQYKVGEDTGFTIIGDHINGIRGDYSLGGFSPSAEYFFKDNWSVIARFNYSNLGVNLDRAALSLSDDLGIDIQNQHFKRQSYELALGARCYVPFMGSKIFGWFVEGSFNGGYEQSMFYGITEDDLKQGTYNSRWKIALRLDPGICFFVHENFDFEVSVGLMDITWKQLRQNENQVKDTVNHGWDAGFSIDLLAIRFGAHFYL